MSLSRYSLGEEIYRSVRVRVIRGVRLSDDLPVVLKIHARAFPTLSEHTKLRQEFEFGAKLDLPGSIRYHELVIEGNRMALVMEDSGGASLHEHLRRSQGEAPHPVTLEGIAPTLDLESFLQIAISLARTLDAVHKAGLVHKHINSQHVLIHPVTLQTKLIDFGLASPLRSERQPLERGRIEGMLTHVSPEQTGRTNHAVDERSDLYSLGVCLYQLLTGRPPFESDDPLELIHCHLAKAPPPLSSAVPDQASKLVLRLLAKAPNERYASASALLADLLRAQRRLTHGSDPLAEPADAAPEPFQIPDHIYGREMEKAALLDALERASSGAPELLLIGGYSGIGKTSLVFEAQSSIVARRANFVSGKFDQYKRNTPYASFMTAFQELVKQMLSEDENVLAYWQHRIRNAVGVNGQILTDLLPEIEHVIGPQSETPPMVGEEAQRRFNETLCQFIRCLATEQHPLVIFLDDLQWADAGTLALIRLFLTDPNVQHVLLIGAYRDNEVNPNHPMCITVDELQAAHAPVTTLTLSSLSREALGQLVAGALRRAPDVTRELAALIYEKTEGSPFFSNQLLATLHQDGLIWFSHGAWSWNMEGIRAAEIQTNVIELMAKRLRTLPESTRETLRMAACIGSSFDTQTLAIVQGKSLGQVSADLAIALRGQFVVPTNQHYKVAFVYDLETTQDGSILGLVAAASFRFLHDRVQQAAYSLIQAEDLPDVHLKIGRLLHQSSSQRAIDESFFDIVNHYNVGRDRIGALPERYVVAELNLEAAKRAKDSFAFEAALHYAAAARSALPEGAWSARYELAKTIHLGLSEAEFLNGRYVDALATLDKASPHVDHVLDQGHICERKVLLYKMMNDLNAAWETGTTMLRRLGVELGRSPDEETLESERRLTSEMTRGRTIEQLAVDAQMVGPEQEAACRILQELWPVGFFLGSLGMHVAAMKIVQISAQHGSCGASVFGYMGYAFAQVFLFMNIDDGYKMGKVSLLLHDRFQNREVETKILDLWGGLIQHYKEPIREGRATLWRGFTRGLEFGDYQWAGYCAMNYSYLCVVGDVPLDEAIRHIDRVLPTLRKYDRNMTNTQLIVREAVSALVEPRADPLLLTGAWCDEQEMLRYSEENNEKYTSFVVYFHKLLLALVFDRRDALLSCARAAGETVSGSAGIWINPVFHYLQCLALLDVHESLSPEEGRDALEIVRRNLARIVIWREHAPFNYLHMELVIRAELARVEGHPDVMRLYDEAIAAGRLRGFTHDQGLACERAARFYSERGAQTAARGYLMEARYCYERWGAAAKVAQLDQRFPELWAQRLGEPVTKGIAQDIDVLSIVKAAQAVSSSLRMDSLLDNLLAILIENAGATFGALVTIDGDGGERTGDEAATISERLGQSRFIVSVRNHVGEAPIRETKPSTEDDLLAKAINVRMLKYAIRTRQRILVNDTSEDRAGPFGLREFAERTGARSVVVLPIVGQDEVRAVAVLHNQAAANAFTEDRLEVLRLLSSQASLSLHNARLFADLEKTSNRLLASNDLLEEYSRTLAHKVEERTHELSEKNAELGDAVQQLRGTQRQLVMQEKLASLGALTAGIAHEIRNPLNFVNNFAEIAIDLVNDLEAELATQEHTSGAGKETIVATLGDLRQAATKICDHGKRAAQIVSNMLLHSRTGGGDRTRADLNAVVTGSVNLVLTGARTKDLGFEVDLELDLDPSIGEMDLVVSDIYRVFTNLLGNACYALRQKQASSPGGPRSCLTVRTINRGAHVEIRIHDNGIGIPDGVREKIFNPFFTTKPAGEGTGLGLSISRDIIVDGHQGSIEVDARAGEFTEFKVTLPRRRDRS